ncbi:MAG TPA: hypothetical protein VE934_13475 [Polaromonas sp.]|uniref:hypothetical protein n=1 Tax=Polaromonas sp. TaxID=1869339 RepID=UPI002D6910F2|nr:hypothetical protein [Polaromonas sp.]HYW57970.1 hypothetical protein [Polaromonas sp.]
MIFNLRAGRRVAVAAFVAVLSGCAFNPLYSVTPGLSRDEVVARMGTPRAVVPLNKGTRLQYSLQPAGRYAYMVDLDQSGRVLSIRQVLNSQDFARIELGKWTKQDVLREFGPPSSVDHVASWKGDILTYKWFDVQNMFYWVYLDRNGVVQRAHPGMEEDFFLPDNVP